jgi:hypothetical protein
VRPFSLFDPGSGSSRPKSVQIHGIRIHDTDCKQRFKRLCLIFFFVPFLSHSLFVVYSPPGDQLWNVESLSALFISPLVKKILPSPPFLSRDFFFPEAWQEKLENTATNCPVQWRGTREGERSTFPSILRRFSP